MKRKLSVIIEFEHTDLNEYRLREKLLNEFGVTDQGVTLLPVVSHLKEDSNYSKLRKQIKAAKDNLNNYIDKNRYEKGHTPKEL